MRINTNIVSQKTQENLRVNQEAQSKAMNRLSSGSRINSAADDAAGLAITTRMNVKASGLEIASRNSSDGLSLIETAESAMDSINSILTRMRELSLASTNGTVNPTDRGLYDDEFQQLKLEVERIVEQTNFNGIDLLNGKSGTEIKIQASDRTDATANDSSTISITLTDLTDLTSALTDIKTNTAAESAIDELDTAIDSIASARATQGAAYNRLEFNVANLNNQKINTEQAASRIADADMAAEMSEMTRAKILTETSISMLSQANQTPQMISQLLQ